MPLAAADAPLFPTPLHLVRRVEDPIAKTTSQVDEYCVANRIITIDGYKTVVVDYDMREIVEINRAASTYSVSRFEEVAATNARLRGAIRLPTAATRWTSTSLGVRTSLAGRSADAFEITTDATTIDLRIDREIWISRKAFDALAGVDSRQPDPQHDAIATAAARPALTAAKSDPAYGIPLEQSITFHSGRGPQLTFRNAIVRIDSDLPPPDLLAIPAGARLVASRAETLRKSLDELKEAPPHP